MKVINYCTCLLLFAITSCKKDKVSDKGEPPACRVSAVFLYKNFARTPADSAIYVIEGGLTREIKTQERTVRLVYRNNNIVRKDYIPHGSDQRSDYDTIYYNSRNEMQEIAHYRFSATTMTFELSYLYEFVYEEGKLAHIFHRGFYKGSVYMLNEHHFTYDRGNIIRNDAIRYNTPTWTNTYRFDYVYGDSLSPIPAIFKFNLLLLPDFNFNNEFLPMFISRNLMTMSYLPVGTRPITYLRDDRNNIIAVENGPYPGSSHPTIGFRYQCP
jgi:hypothetical protein